MFLQNNQYIAALRTAIEDYSIALQMGDPGPVYDIVINTRGVPRRQYAEQEVQEVAGIISDPSKLSHDD